MYTVTGAWSRVPAAPGSVSLTCTGIVVVGLSPDPDADVVVATDDRLERDVVGGMGVATMGARALETEVARVAADLNSETRRMRDDSRRTTRVEDGLDPEVRARLERIRRGEDR